MKDSFIVQLAVELGLKALATLFPKIAFLFGGCPGMVFSYFATRYLGFLVDQAILVIDLSLIAQKVALERDEYREAAIKAYKHATSKIHTEEEKRAIRKQYLDVTRKFARVGNGMRGN